MWSLIRAPLSAALGGVWAAVRPYALGALILTVIALPVGLYGWHRSVVKAEVAAAVEGLVTQAELDAAKALLAQEKRRRRAAITLVSINQQRAAEQAARAEKAQAALDRLAAQAGATPGLSYPTAADLDWQANR